MSRRFQRTIEDFVCDHCGFTVEGTGYTNHCPLCLWSSHVDVMPGDRKSECGGMMEPVAVEKRADGYRILHRCQVCGKEKWNQASPEDDFDRLVMIAELLGKQNSG